MKWKIEKELPEKPNVPPGKNIRKNIETLVIEKLTLVTPMLGGGVESLKTDGNMPIRTQAVKGQLRFWWRTFQTFENVEDLKEKEDKIWGSTAKASKVSINTSDITQGIDFPYDESDKSLPHYVLFSIKNSTEIINPKLRKGTIFNLSLSYPSGLKTDVENSLKLWLLFGGIGARTRRGMGTFYSPKWPGWKNSQDVIDWLQSIINKNDNQNQPWPNLFGARLCVKSDKNANIAWSSWINRYQNFRQQRKDNKHGKSIWPEPNAIRLMHKSGKIEGNSFFPRGAYGLPVMFHFPKKHIERNKEVKYSLECTTERWASPFIIKVLKLDEKNCLKICLQLNSPLPEKWSLNGENKQIELKPNARPMDNHPLKNNEPLNGDDPHTVLLKYMSNGGEIITLGGVE